MAGSLHRLTSAPSQNPPNPSRKRRPDYHSLGLSGRRTLILKPYSLSLQKYLAASEAMSGARRSRSLIVTSSDLFNVEGAMNIDIGYPSGVNLYCIPLRLMFPRHLALLTTLEEQIASRFGASAANVVTSRTEFPVTVVIADAQLRE